FDERAEVFRWDVDRIRAKNYTDNVVDLMSAKVRRLAATTQDALKELACLGNAADVDVLTLVRGGPEEQPHAELWDAVVAGLVVRQADGKYKFLHDRVQEAAYALVPEEQRAELHLRLGRILSSRMSKEAIAEHVFEIVNQWNRGLALVTDPEERLE